MNTDRGQEQKEDASLEEQSQGETSLEDTSQEEKQQARNPDTVPWKELKVLGFCSHRKYRYPTDRQWLSVFSNWFPSNFMLSENVGTDDADQNTQQFIMVEQWMMWKKARRYGDQEAADRIMKSNDPAEMKRIGRGVRGYRHQDWCAVRYDIVLRGVIAKFKQNKDLGEILAQTEDQTLAEAATYDKVWGIGLHRTDPRTQDEKQWKGLNLLGKALMEARGKIYHQA